MARNDAEYRAHLRRAMRQERQPQITLPDLLVMLATLALIGAIAWVLWGRGFFAAPPAPTPAPAPVQVAPPAPAYSAPLPTLQPAQAEIIGAQQPHAIRGAEPTPAPVVDIPAPEFVAPVELPPAAPVPTIDNAQATVIGARQSNGCAAGETFFPRVGCHATGSGGAMPGPVGEP